MIDNELIKQGACGAIGTAISLAGFGLSEIEQIVSIICSVAGLVITVAGVIVIPIIRRIKAAKADDGRIDLDEAQEIIDAIQDGLNELNKKK